MRYYFFVAILSAAAVAGTHERAHAYGYGDALVACAAQNTDVYNAILTDMAGFCGVERGRKSACQRIEGDPWVCSEKAGPNPVADDYCFGGVGKISFEISATTPIPTGWGITGSVKAEISHSAQLRNQKDCDATPKDEPPLDGAAGKFVSLSGRLHYFAKIKLEGEVKIKGPPGEFTVKAGVECVARASGAIHQKDTTQACTAKGACAVPAEDEVPSEVADEVASEVEATPHHARAAVCIVEEEPDYGAEGDGEVDTTIDPAQPGDEDPLPGDEPVPGDPDDLPVTHDEPAPLPTPGDGL